MRTPCRFLVKIQPPAASRTAAASARPPQRARAAEWRPGAAGGQPWLTRPSRARPESPGTPRRCPNCPPPLLSLLRPQRLEGRVVSPDTQDSGAQLTLSEAARRGTAAAMMVVAPPLPPSRRIPSSREAGSGRSHQGRRGGGGARTRPAPRGSYSGTTA